jgi:hypothetical protein
MSRNTRGAGGAVADAGGASVVAGGTVAVAVASSGVAGVALFEAVLVLRIRGAIWVLLLSLFVPWVETRVLLAEVDAPSP